MREEDDERRDVSTRHPATYDGYGDKQRYHPDDAARIGELCAVTDGRWTDGQMAERREGKGARARSTEVTGYSGGESHTLPFTSIGYRSAERRRIRYLEVSYKRRSPTRKTVGNLKDNGCRLSVGARPSLSELVQWRNGQFSLPTAVPCDSICKPLEAHQM